MGQKISALINTLNDQSGIEQAIKSVKWADEIIVCDMQSEDKTVEIAKRLGVKVVSHKRLEYVEPARNLAVSKATGEWILIIDPDEEIPDSLKDRLIEIANNFHQIHYVKIPRKNVIFGKWMKQSLWWPDYNIRFFKKGTVEWGDRIHRPPQTFGEGLDLSAEEKWAIIHHHYNSVSQFLERMIRYTNVQAKELISDGYKFDWRDLIKKPLAEFLGRFFANKGFIDGLHGLVLSLLQAFSFFVVYLRVWEMEKFTPQDLKLEDLKEVSNQAGEEIGYWLKYANLSSNPFIRLLQKAKNKL